MYFLSRLCDAAAFMVVTAGYGFAGKHVRSVKSAMQISAMRDKAPTARHITRDRTRPSCVNVTVVRTDIARFQVFSNKDLWLVSYVPGHRAVSSYVRAIYEILAFQTSRRFERRYIATLRNDSPS